MLHETVSRSGIACAAEPVVRTANASGSNMTAARTGAPAAIKILRRLDISYPDEKHSPTELNAVVFILIIHYFSISLKVS